MPDQSSVEIFCGHFRRFLEQLAELPDEPTVGMLKKLGFVATIDALSDVGTQGRYTRQNRQRFVEFIFSFSEWREARKLSLPLLVQALLKEEDRTFDDLREHSTRLLDGWPTDAPGPRHVSCDPEPDDLLGLWPTNGSSLRTLRGLPQHRFCHAHLLYTQRTFLAHELREGGWPTIERGVEAPYYSYTRIGRIEDGGRVLHRETWLLHYSVGFLSTLTDCCLDKLEEWLRSGEIDPFDYYTGSDYLLAEL